MGFERTRRFVEILSVLNGVQNGLADEDNRELISGAAGIGTAANLTERRRGAGGFASGFLLTVTDAS